LNSAVNSPTSRREADRERKDRNGKAHKKANGVFYTSPQLAALLCGWALEKEPKRILEPSFGEGIFLREAEAKLREQGVRNPGRRLFGVEIDPKGPIHLRASGSHVPEGHLHTADLLSLDAKALGGRFGAIVGNPPYIRHHLLDEELIKRGRESAAQLGIELNGRSDAWAYFCAHLVTFLAADGRMALVLPGSVLQAAYAKPLLAALAKEEGEVQLIRIGKRLFPRVQERTVLLMIDRSRPSGEPVIHRSIADLKGLGGALKRRPRTASRKSGQGGEEEGEDRSSWRLLARESAAWEEACLSEGIVRLGEEAKVRIGVVTGANRFFVRSAAEAEALGKRVKSVPIVSRGAWLAAPRWSAAAQRKVGEDPSRLLLFPRSGSGLSKLARMTLEDGEEEGLDERYHCSNREPWFRITDTEAPQLFLPYMASQPPRLVVNDAGATCTNTIHRVWMNPDSDLRPETIAAGSWTTLYRLSAELVGRTYGGGVLKLEPSGATALRIAVGGDAGLLTEIGEAYRGDGISAARQLADQRLLVDAIGISRKTLTILAGAADRLAELRHR
jgi:adenine-specific DNA-methyltransferase